MSLTEPLRAPHASRIAGFPLHPDRDALLQAVEFWGAGLELDLPTVETAAGAYLRRCAQRGEWQMEPRALPPPPVAQLDVETDDLEAEAARLEELGARRVGHLRQHWWELELPTGQRIRVAMAADAAQAGDAFRWG
jgi:hypothetical protein